MKPQAQRWTSTAHVHEHGVSSDWVEWCAQAQPEWLNDQGVLYDVKPGAKILIIRTDADAQAVAAHYGVKINSYELFLKMPWHRIAEDFDAIHHIPTSHRFSPSPRKPVGSLDQQISAA